MPAHCETKAVYRTCQYGFRKGPPRIQAASFREFYLCGCEPLSITVCLFPSMLRNSFINHPPHIPCRLPIYLLSLQRPYAACLTKPFTVLFLFPIASLYPLLFHCIRTAAEAIEGPEGAKRCEKPLPCFHMVSLPLSCAHMLQAARAGKHAHISDTLD